MISRRTLFGGATVGALAVAGCSSTAADPAATSYTLGLTYIPNVQFAPFYMAVDEGLFTAKGLSITLRHHGAQEDLFGAVLAGREHLVCASSDEAVVAAASGQSLATFATTYQRYPVCVIAPEASGVKGLGDLKGKRIGLPGRYGSSWYGLLSALSAAGMTADDVVVAEIGYTGVSALLTSKVDAIVGFVNNEPLQFAAQNLPVTVLPVVDASSPNLVGPGLIAQPQTLTADVRRRIADALLEAERKIVANPALAIEATAKQVPDLAEASARANAEAVLAETAKLWMSGSEVSVAVDTDAFARMSDLLSSAGITDQKVDPASVVLSQ